LRRSSRYTTDIVALQWNSANVFLDLNQTLVQDQQQTYSASSVVCSNEDAAVKTRKQFVFFFVTIT